MRFAVVPALNEARSIGSVVLKARQHVDHVLVVDDGSTDDTTEVARLAGADVVVHEGNRGKGVALATGIRMALERGAGAMVLLDADGQHDPASIPALLQPIADGTADIVVGARSLNGDGVLRRHRKAGRQILDAATNAVAGTSVSDTQSGYRALSAEAAKRLVPTEDGMGVESIMLVQAARNGLRVVEVPVAQHYPKGVRPHQHPARHGASVLNSLLRFVREEHPLAFFGGIGILCLGYGAYAGFVTADHYYSTNEFWPGKAMQAMLFLILGSIALMGAIMLDFLSAKLRGLPRRER